MNDFEFVPLFATPLYFSKIEISNSIKNTIFKLSLNRKDEARCFVSENCNVLNLEDLLPLKVQVEYHIKKFTDVVVGTDDQVQYPIIKSWVVKHVEGDHAHRHLHVNSLFSGVVYLKTDENAGSFSIINPFRNAVPEVLSPTTHRFNHFNSKVWSFTPKENSIIIFPSFLEHMVSPCLSKQERYCLPFNVFIKGNLRVNDSLSSLEICGSGYNIGDMT